MSDLTLYPMVIILFTLQLWTTIKFEANENNVPYLAINNIGVYVIHIDIH